MNVINLGDGSDAINMGDESGGAEASPVSQDRGTSPMNDGQKKHKLRISIESNTMSEDIDSY